MFRKGVWDCGEEWVNKLLRVPSAEQVMPKGREGSLVFVLAGVRSEEPNGLTPHQALEYSL